MSFVVPRNWPSGGKSDDGGLERQFRRWHGITQAQFLYVFEPGGNRIELFGEPGILQLEPDYETRTWLMEDIDTGLAIGGAKLPFETYFTYGTPSKLSVEEHAEAFLTGPPPETVETVPDAVENSRATANAPAS